MSPYDRERYDPRPRYGDDYGRFNALLRHICAQVFHQMLILVLMVIGHLLVGSFHPAHILRRRGGHPRILVRWIILQR